MGPATDQAADSNTVSRPWLQSMTTRTRKPSVGAVGFVALTIETAHGVLAGETEAGFAAAEDLRVKHRMVASAFRMFFQRCRMAA